MKFLTADETKNRMFSKMVIDQNGNNKPIYKIVKDRKGVFEESEKAFMFVELRPVTFRSSWEGKQFDTYKMTVIPAQWNKAINWAEPVGEPIEVIMTKVDYDSLVSKYGIAQGDLLSVQGHSYKRGTFEMKGRNWYKHTKTEDKPYPKAEEPVSQPIAEGEVRMM